MKLAAHQFGEEDIVTAASTGNSSHYVGAQSSSQGRTVNIAFAVDSIYSNQASLDTFRINITNTLKSLLDKTNIKIVFIDNNRNKKVGEISFDKSDNYDVKQRWF